LLRIADRYPQLILCGDFNIPRGTPLYRRLVKRFQSWVPENYASSLDPELFREPQIQRMVDHLLTTRGYVCRDVALRSGLSDHQAIVAHILPASEREEETAESRRALSYGANVDTLPHVSNVR
jgi:endonuclease/exonuclease/phosphatase family metal-dependent hydrolase